jgi:hypothetical protein
MLHQLREQAKGGKLKFFAVHESGNGPDRLSAMSARMSAFGEQTGLVVLTLSFVDHDPQRTSMGLHSATSSTVGLAECRIHKETRDAAGRAGADRKVAFREVGDSTAAEIEVWLLGC